MATLERIKKVEKGTTHSGSDPGATYRLLTNGGMEGPYKDFTVKSGETLDLGEFTPKFDTDPSSHEAREPEHVCMEALSAYERCPLEYPTRSPFAHVVLLFAANWSEVQRDLREGPEAAIHRLLNGHEHIKSKTDFEAISQNISQSAVASNNANRLKPGGSSGC